MTSRKLLAPIALGLGLMSGCAEEAEERETASDEVGCSEPLPEDPRCLEVIEKYEQKVYDALFRGQNLSRDYGCGFLGPLSWQLAESRAEKCVYDETVQAAFNTSFAIKELLRDECGFVGEFGF